MCQKCIKSNIITFRAGQRTTFFIGLFYQMAGKALLRCLHKAMRLKMNTMQLETPGGNHCCLIIIVYF